MGIVRLNELPEGSGNLTNDDIFVFMDNPGASGITRKISLSELSEAIGTGSGGPSTSLPVIDLGTVSGSNSINGGINNAIQTLTLNGTPVTFTKGTGWSSTADTSEETVLKITVSSPTSITWTIVNQWFNRSSGPLASGVHLFLLRSVGTSTIEGHYIGSET